MFIGGRQPSVGCSVAQNVSDGAEALPLNTAEGVCSKLPSAPPHIPQCLLGIGGASSNDFSDWWTMIVGLEEVWRVCPKTVIDSETDVCECVGVGVGVCCSSCRTGLSSVRRRYFKVKLSVQSRGSLFKGYHPLLMNDSTIVCPSPTPHQDQLEEVVAWPMRLQHRIDSVCAFVCVCVRS